MPSAWRWPALLASLAIGSALIAWLAASHGGPAPLHVLVVPAPPATPYARAAYIGGAVLHPGVYPVIDGYRLADLIAAAGGPTRSGDTSRLNLARRIADGERVDVPERPLPATAAEIAINRASRSELLKLPGMTEQAARSIKDSVRTDGPLRSARDMADRNIVPLSIVDAIAPLVDWTP